MEGIPAGALDCLRGNLERVHRRIREAAAGSGRPPGGVRLVAVTKAVPAWAAAALVSLGQADLAENRPEEVPLKAAALRREGLEPRWHLIGRYQSRKIAATLPYIDWVHSIHSVDLLERLAARLLPERKPLPVLLQVNVSGEASKQGFRPGDLPAALELAKRSLRLAVQGLMTIAPEGLPSQELRAVFRGLREERDRLASPDLPLSELSMGMSGDFVEAVQEGATIVRIGSALFAGLPGLPGNASPSA